MDTDNERQMTSAATLRRPNWAWTVGSGDLTLVLGLVALFLPEIHWTPKGGIVGWLLVFAGVAEIALSVARGLDRIGTTALVSGLLSAAAGLTFVANPLASYFPVANVVMAWLMVRGLWVVLMGWSLWRRPAAAWLLASGAVDICLALVLAAGLPIATLVYVLFGPTPELVANFSLILGASFLATGFAQVAIGLHQRSAGSVKA
jgi:uncharacterized membrane protein HdeD (DUF308 family)